MLVAFQAGSFAGVVVLSMSEVAWPLIDTPIVRFSLYVCMGVCILLNGCLHLTVLPDVFINSVCK